MNILIITNKMPYPPRDGGSIATFSLAEDMKEAGNNITILAMNTSKHEVKPEDIPQIIRSDFNLEIVDINTDISPAKALKNLLFSKTPYNAERFISRKFADKLKNILSENKFDIVQLEGLYLCPYISVIKKFPEVKIALRAHNIEHEIWDRTAENEKNQIKKAYLKILARRIKNFKIKYLNQYDFIIPITEKDRDRYNLLGNLKPSKVIQTGVDMNNYTPNIDNTEYPGIFHIGALDWRPNQEGILWFLDNVWNRILQVDNNIKFYIAGRNAPDWFQNELNKRKNVVNLGEVENAKDFMNSKSIMVIPLFSGSGMRIKIIEGMALGKLIITTDLGTEGINTENHKNIIIANTAEQFFSEIKKLLTNKKDYYKITRNAINFVAENYDNKVMANELINFYKTNL